MHDRQPGAPGQYTMTIQADQLAKLLAGEACTIVLVRDDQPIAVGTPIIRHPCYQMIWRLYARL